LITISDGSRFLVVPEGQGVPENLDEDIVMKNRDAREEWYVFTAPEDGIVEFEVEDPIWVRDHWSCGIVKECGSTQDKLSFEELMGKLTYRYSVIKGETYRFTVYQFKNEEGADIVIKTKFTPAGEGESCDKAINIDFDKVVICKDVASETWYEFVAPEAGEYYLVSSLGQGAGVSYKIGDCSTKAITAEVKDFMYGRAYATLNLEKDQIVAYSGGKSVRALMSGIVRGMLQPGVNVTIGMKCGDIDARCKEEYCYTISDKARAIGGGVLEAIMEHFNGEKHIL